MSAEGQRLVESLLSPRDRTALKIGRTVLNWVEGRHQIPKECQTVTITLRDGWTMTLDPHSRDAGDDHHDGQPHGERDHETPRLGQDGLDDPREHGPIGTPRA